MFCGCCSQARALKAVKEVGDALVLDKLKAVGLVTFRDSAEWGGKPVSEWSEQRRGAKEASYKKGTLPARQGNPSREKP